MSKAMEHLRDLIKAKYIRRVPKAGGGYTYIYKEDVKKKGKGEDNKKLNPKYKNKIFGRINSNGNVDLLDYDTGEAVTKLDESIYPIGSDTSARYEHPAGIEILKNDAKKLGLEIEK